MSPQRSILRVKKATLAQFAQVARGPQRPVITTVPEWPATVMWKDPDFWRMQYGKTLIPVEIYSTNKLHSPEMTSIALFLDKYIFSGSSASGLVTRYPLLDALPELKLSISLPPYFQQTTPTPATTPDPSKEDSKQAATKKPGPSPASVDASDSDLLHSTFVSWGPAGITTDVHKEPLPTFISQVFGYNYYRIYPPTEAERLYAHPRSNTSAIPNPLAPLEDDLAKYPLFSEASYIEGILRPAELLYIPKGFWYTTKLLSYSFQVQFWVSSKAKS